MKYKTTIDDVTAHASEWESSDLAYPSLIECSIYENTTHLGIVRCREQGGADIDIVGSLSAAACKVLSSVLDECSEVW